MNRDKINTWAKILFPGIIDAAIGCFALFAFLYGLGQLWKSCGGTDVQAPAWAAPPEVEVLEPAPELPPTPRGRWIAHGYHTAFPPTGEFVVNAPKGAADEGRVRATFRFDKWPVRVTVYPPGSDPVEIQISEGGWYSAGSIER